MGSTRSTVSLSNAGRTVTLVPEGVLAPGAHTLIVGELVSAKGKRLTDAFVLPFFVSDSRAKISSAIRVESIVRLRIERLGTVRVSSTERPDGRYIEIMKAVNRKSGRAIELAYDRRGKRINAEEVFAKIRRECKKEFASCILL